jgi:hypothetical protein
VKLGETGCFSSITSPKVVVVLDIGSTESSLGEEGVERDGRFGSTCRNSQYRSKREDSLEGYVRGGETLWKSGVTGGVAGIESKRAQALGRGPSVDIVSAGRRFVEEARWRIGGGERAAIMGL